MKPLKRFTIQFVGLKEGIHTFKYYLDKTFFEYFDFEDFNDLSASIVVSLHKKTTFLELNFQLSGAINVNCDVSSEAYDQDISDQFSLVVKFGQKYNDDHEDILIIPHGTYEINIAQYIYELIVLAIPSKRIHPGIEDGTLKSDIVAKLRQLSPSEAENEQNSQETDPRWDKLKKLLTDK